MKSKVSAPAGLKFASMMSILLSCILSACTILPISPADTPTIPSRSVTPTVSPTIQWFPPTNTPAPFPTAAQRQPTPEQRPALGEVVVRDTFESNTGWAIGQFSGGTATLGRQRLDLVTQPVPGAGLVSLRNGALPGDLYIELTMAPSLCRGKDNYGLVFRAESEISHYRLVITCDGQLRVERWRPSEVLVIQDWTVSGQVPSGAPVSLRVGVWVYRDEMRIFIGDIYQFGLRDPLVQGAQLGVFVRAATAGAVSVSFSDLAVRKVEGYSPSPVPSATVFVVPSATRAPTFTTVP